jgi:hypothetical protein
MRIHLYTRCWNDMHMLGFFFRHYDPLVQRYFIFDDGSTDGSYRFLRSLPKVTLQRMPPRSDPESRVASGLAVLESCWKASRGAADWVIVTDIDEHIHHAQDISAYLRACKARGVTIIPALGYEMIAEDFPRDDLLLSNALTMGAPWSVMSKMNIFSPDDIVAANFAPGRHRADPVGNVVAPPRDELLLLHYRHLGFERTLERHALARARQRPKDLANGWGFQYSWTREQLAEHWKGLSGRAIDIADPNLRPWNTHEGERWWDRYRLRE